MKITIRKADDIDEVKALHRLAFPTDKWPGDDHQYWIARDEQGEVVGICSCYHWTDINAVYLSRAAVVKRLQGYGLQKRMISVRVRWARSQGAMFVATYCTRKNYPSLVSLLRSRFMFFVPSNWSEWKDFHLFYLPLFEPYDRELLNKAAEYMS